MNRTGMPWMLLVLALLGWQVGGTSGGGTAAKPAAKSAEQVAASLPKKAEVSRSSAPVWPELGRLVGDYFGAKTNPEASSDLLQLVKDAKYRPPDVYIALVADPIDSFLPARFDQALAGIQTGFAQAGYLLDRIDLPWTTKPAVSKEGESTNEPAYRTRPGILLFRRPGQERNGRLAIVLLVGETAKGGVHKTAFRLALDAAHSLATPHRLATGRAIERIRILGPTFSGSRESLRLAFAAWKPKVPTAERPEIWMVSGSATSTWLDLCAFDCRQGVRFFRTVMGDDELLSLGHTFLVEKLGWSLDRMALLTEADTAYGKNANQVVESKRPEEGESPEAESFVLKFPSGLSGLRKASEDAARGTAPNKDQPRLGPSTLAISLADQSRPVDVVPEFSNLTTPTKDLALSNLLAVLCGEGKKSYLGIVATDSRDQIFLAERVQEICPDLQLFFLDSDLLLAHPQNSDALDGAIILSSSALFTRGLSWLEEKTSENSTNPALGVRLFQSDLQEGVVQAVEALLADVEKPATDRPARLEAPHAWVSAIGNGSIWPLAQIQRWPWSKEGPLHLESTFETGATFEQSSAKANALTLTCLLFIAALSFWLVRAGRPLREIPDLPEDLRDRFPFLLAFSAILISWGVLQVVGGLPLWAFGRLWEEQEAMALGGLMAGSLFALLGLAAFVERNRLPPRFPQLPNLGVSLRWIAVVSLGVAAGGLLAWPLLHGWMPGGIELFHFRARKFTGGMSPIVSIAWIGGGNFLWSILEMKRRTLVAFQGAQFPIPPLPGEDPILPGCRRIAASLERRMMHTFPTWCFWAVIGPPAGLAGIYIYKFVQPVAETRAYGQVFAGLAMGLFILALVSFHRFLRLWADLSKLLDRIETLGLGPALRRLHPEVDWRPMKSFAWLIPPFKMTELSIAKLAAAGGSADGTELRRLLAQALEGHREGDPVIEAAGRNALQSHFDAALAQAEDWLAPGPLQDFVAVRLIAYVRTVFAHLRNSLLSSLVPGFLLLLAISTYEIQPKRVLFLSIWSALAAAVLMTIWAFVHMDRNPTLSAIGGSTAGETNLLDRSFIQSVLTYGILPLLGLVATRFPQIERLFQSYLNPLMRFVGGGGGGG